MQGAETLDWYKDAIIYQTHIKAFFDSNGDGIGDFAGLTAKLDYISELGVTAIWLLPFYPSPLRDDGYDIANYTDVNPSYGTIEDFRAFIREAHTRGLKVITELVINHTSDQHPWFQRARNAPKGSEERNWYVWSDDDKLYSGTRIIFTDTEKSNWTWDPVAQQYFWHRFFSHQPDLNFDHPPVLEAIKQVMYFWLEEGVDGLRLDAIPYLCERDGTSNENIPETHQVIKKLRKALDDRFPDRFFLAEANMWPEEVIPYFGDDDECHMSFHFPLMPRMYMAVAQEDRHPITDIMRQTPEISPRNQWAIFLRNHDELTLEMVTDRDRDYLWNTYAADKRMRVNVGIRRRLAPLMGNDRRKIELMNSLLFSMPGTPIVYYGDEIGMGDNIYLGDRDGVRTPMQWSMDRNGGYSRTDAARLYLPAIMDPVYGFAAINVEAQSRSTSSLLSWMKRTMAVRKSRNVFGRGRIEFLYPANRQVLAYLRTYEDTTLLCVANLSHSAQAVELDLSAYKGSTPVEMMGNTSFPRVTELPYLLTLSPYGFFWFQLTATDTRGQAALPVAAFASTPEYFTLIMTGSAVSLVQGRNKGFLDRNIVPQFAATQPWSDMRGKRPSQVNTREFGVLNPQGGNTALLTTFTTQGPSGDLSFFLPIGVEWLSTAELTPQQQASALAKVRQGPKEGMALDVLSQTSFVAAFAGAMAAGETLQGADGAIDFVSTDRMPKTPVPVEFNATVDNSAEPAKSSVTVRDYGVLKFYRHLLPGTQPALEMSLYLASQPLQVHTPVILGHAEVAWTSGDRSTLAIFYEYLQNQGDGWTYTLNELNRYLDQQVVLDAEQLSFDADDHRPLFDFVRALGVRSAGLHSALSQETADQAFSPEPITQEDLSRWQEEGRTQLRNTLESLKQQPEHGDRAQQLLDHQERFEAELTRAFDGLQPDGQKTRIHGDLHLGNILVSEGDAYITNLEGGCGTNLEERKIKRSPMADVASVLRSFDYASGVALDRVLSNYESKRPLLEPLVLSWRDEAVRIFLEAYWGARQQQSSAAGPTPFDQALLKMFGLQRAFYEVESELRNSTKWQEVAMGSILRLLQTS